MKIEQNTCPSCGSSDPMSWCPDPWHVPLSPQAARPDHPWRGVAVTFGQVVHYGGLWLLDSVWLYRLVMLSSVAGVVVASVVSRPVPWPVAVWVVGNVVLAGVLLARWVVVWRRGR